MNAGIFDLLHHGRHKCILFVGNGIGFGFDGIFQKHTDEQRAIGFFFVVNAQHIFHRKRLEIKFVRGIVIGRNGFRVAVHHNRLEAGLFYSKCSVYTAIFVHDVLPFAGRLFQQQHQLFERLFVEIFGKSQTVTACFQRTNRFLA
jgi:hypothetical protein